MGDRMKPLRELVAEARAEVAADRAAGRCWFGLHRWTVWAKEGSILDSEGGVVAFYQRRQCVRCGRLQDSEI
jgi:hypothetical protein